MSELQTISTFEVPVHKRVRYWNKAVSECVSTRSMADPLDTATFAGCLKRLDVGDIRFAEVNGGASRVRRSPAPSRAGHYVLGLILSGEIFCYTDGTELRIGAGDFWLFSAGSGAEMLLPQPVSLLGICIPRGHLLRHMDCPEATNSIVVSGQSGPGALASRYVRDFWSHVGQDIPLQMVPRFAEVGLQLIAGAYAEIPGSRPNGSTLLAQHQIRIRSYIERHLHESELSPVAVAEALRITPSYVHRLFSVSGESIARYILRRRLERCHHALSDSMQSGRSITTIAIEHGFVSPQHFSKVFRSRFGYTPRELRQRGLEPLKLMVPADASN